MAVFVLNKYYRLSKAVPAYTAAVLLDPSRRKQHLRKIWDPPEIRQIISQVQTIWNTKYKNLPSLEHQPQPPNKKGKGRQDKTKSPLDEILDELDAPVDPMIDDHFLSFIDASPVALQGLSPLEWWCQKENRTRYPQLHKMALDILSIPPMSDAPERTFSCARRTISWSRAKLKPENVEMVETLASWISQGFVSFDQTLEELVQNMGGLDLDSDTDASEGED